MFESPAAVIAILAAVAAFFFWVEQVTKWKLFNFLPPLLFIYSVPVVLSNTGILPAKSPAYDVLSQFGLPVFITLLLLSVDVGAAVRVMGKGIFVMLLGTVGVVVGAPIGYFAVHRWLPPDAWKGFGALAGSWIGGTGNMAAVAGGLETSPEMFGLAVLADNVIYVIWLPVLLASKGLAERFNRWMRVSEDRVAQMEAAAETEAASKTEKPVLMRHFLYLGAIALGATAISVWMAPMLPEIEPILSTSTWRVLIVTTIGIGLSFTPARALPRSHELAMAIVYVFVAGMGARASLAGLGDAPAFLLGAFIWIIVHGLFCLGGAWVFKVDVHSAAIASAANIGGAASAPVVAAYHREALVPVSILMALIGYAIGNYAAFLAARLCYWVGSF
ncbi:MAG TPA: DUF819 family protein [Thermoanaerobaculia bacterium]|nr:DUF819 family protein [Thermoanaerobaculia bacterium]